MVKVITTVFLGGGGVCVGLGKGMRNLIEMFHFLVLTYLTSREKIKS